MCPDKIDNMHKVVFICGLKEEKVMLTGSLYLCSLDRTGTTILKKQNFWIEIKKVFK